MQSIYRFREAEVSLFMHARTLGLPSVRLEPLTLRTNFRSQSGLVEWFNETFEKVLPSAEDAEAGAVPYAAFYSYAYPEPPGFAEARSAPSDAYYSDDLREWILPYDAVRESASPDDTLLEFLETSYAAAAELGKWDRQALERGAS